MTAFAVEVTLLLALVFLLALGAGYRLARRRHGRPGATAMAPRETQSVKPVAAPLPASADPFPVPTSGTGSEMPRPVSAPAPPVPAAPVAPMPDLFARFGIINGTVTLPPEEDEPAPAPVAAAVPRRRGGEAHPGVRPPTLEAPEGEGPDDLKRLKGIGPQNERRLNALGIFHIRQIAAWSAPEAAWVGSYLAFPGRIEREDWVGQARAILDGSPPPGGRSRS